MASNFTENFGLNQWERTDKVLMEDFNADNAKIDAALGFHRSAELIASVTVEDETTTHMVLDISQVDWSRYFMLYLSAQVENPNTFDILTDRGSSYSVRFSYGGELPSFYLALFNQLSKVRGLFLVGYNGAAEPILLAAGLSPTASNYYNYISFSTGFCTTPYQDLSEIRIGGNKLGVGAKAELWGIK